MTEAEAAKAPEGMQMKDLNQMPGYKFAIVVSAFDCTGCGSCVNVCPDKVQAITMTGFEAHEDERGKLTTFFYEPAGCKSSLCGCLNSQTYKPYYF